MARKMGKAGKRGMGWLLLGAAAVVGIALAGKKKEEPPPPPPETAGEIASSTFALEPLGTTPQTYRVRARPLTIRNSGQLPASYDLWLTGYVNGVAGNTNKNSPPELTDLAPGATSSIINITVSIGAGPGAVSAILRLVLRGTDTALDAVDSGVLGTV